jgi:hypothetical protein
MSLAKNSSGDKPGRFSHAGIFPAPGAIRSGVDGASTSVANKLDDPCRIDDDNVTIDGTKDSTDVDTIVNNVQAIVTECVISILSFPTQQGTVTLIEVYGELGVKYYVKRVIRKMFEI